MSSTPGKVPVLLTIDLDGDLPLISSDPTNVDRQKARSVGTYGLHEGAPRILAMLRKRALLATWFIPGMVARQNPELVGQIRSDGHALGVHGHHHKDFNCLALDGQIQEIVDGAAALKEVAGEPVSGFRVPEGEWKRDFPQRIREEGFTWSSSLPSDDRPFMVGNSGLIEIPWRYELEDLQYLAFNLEPEFPPGQSRIASHRTVFENWEVEWEAAKKFGTVFTLRLNSEVIGTPGRVRMLSQFIDKIEHDSASEFMTCPEFIDSDTMPRLLDPEHPYALWEKITSRKGELDHHVR